MRICTLKKIPRSFPEFLQLKTGNYKKEELTQLHKNNHPASQINKTQSSFPTVINKVENSVVTGFPMIDSYHGNTKY